MDYKPVSFCGNKIVSGNTVYLYHVDVLEKGQCSLCNEPYNYNSFEHGIRFGIRATETFCPLCPECYDILTPYLEDNYLSFMIIKNNRITMAKYQYAD